MTPPKPSPETPPLPSDSVLHKCREVGQCEVMQLTVAGLETLPPHQPQGSGSEFQRRNRPTVPNVYNHVGGGGWGVPGYQGSKEEQQPMENLEKFEMHLLSLLWCNS